MRRLYCGLLLLGMAAGLITSAESATYSFGLFIRTPSGTINTKYRDGNDGTAAIPLRWATTINNISINSGASYSVPICQLYLEQASSPYATVSVADGYSLPTGWSIGGTPGVNCTLDYSGTGTTAGTQVKLKAVRSGITAITPNEFTITVTSPVSSETIPPQQVTGVACTSGDVSSTTCSWDEVWDKGSGTDKYEVLIDGVLAATVQENEVVAVQPTLTTYNIGNAVGGTITPSNNQWTLSATAGNTGGGLDSTADGAVAGLTPWTGSSCITFKAISITLPASYSKAGAEDRSTTDSNSVAYSGYLLRQSSGYTFQERRRSTTGGSRGTIGNSSSLTLPAAWSQQCVDANNVITTKWSTDGNAMAAYASETTPLAASRYIGISATATSVSQTVSGVIDQLNITSGKRVSTQITNVASGAHTVTVRAVDKASVPNTGTASAGVAITVAAPADTTAPAAPANPVAANAGQTQLNFTADACTDVSGIANYIWGISTTLGGTYTDQTPGTSPDFQLTGLSASTQRYGKVKCCDLAGNCSTYSSIVNATTASATLSTAPAISSIAVLSNTSVRVTHTTPAGATKYYVYLRWPGVSTWSFMSSFTHTGASVDLTGITANHAEEIYISAANADDSIVIPCTGAPASYCSANGTFSTATTSNAIKFNPGHYLYTDKLLRQASDLSSRISTVISQINSQVCPYPEVTGMQVHVTWGVLEGAINDYSAGFGVVDQIYNALANCQKRLMLVVHERSFGSLDPNQTVPAYLQTSTYGAVQSPGACVSGTQSGYRKGGVIIANGSACAFSGGTTVYPVNYETATVDRLIALSQAYGARYNSASYPYFEMFSPMEELGGSPPSGFGYDTAALATQVQRLFTATRAAWPNTALRLKANYGPTISQQCDLLRNYLVPLNVSIGGPDVIPSVEIWTNQVFSNRGNVCQDFRGAVPWVAEIQNPELGGKSGTYTASQLYIFEMDGGAAVGSGASSSGLNALPLWPQYWVWAYNEFQGGSEQRWSTGIRPYITDTIDGAVGNGRDATRRTPAAVKSGYCPTGYAGGCQ